MNACTVSKRERFHPFLSTWRAVSWCAFEGHRAPLGTVTCQGMLNGLRFLSTDFADFPQIHLRKSAKSADDPLLGDWLVWWVMARELWVRMNQEWQSSTARPLQNHHNPPNFRGYLPCDLPCDWVGDWVVGAPGKSGMGGLWRRRLRLQRRAGRVACTFTHKGQSCDGLSEVFVWE